MVATDKNEALYWFNFYSGKMKFTALTPFSGLSEEKYMFSYAIAKFQHLVIFEE